MKKDSVLVALLIFVLIVFAFCRRSVDSPANGLPIPATLQGRWILTDIQAPGTGPAGIWSQANPAGQWINIEQGGQVSGTAFPAATFCTPTDSVTFKLIDPSQSAGFHLFGYHLDTIAHVLFFYIRPPDGITFCTEGCGAYKFTR